MILVWIVAVLPLSLALPMGYRNDFQDSAQCPYFDACSRNDQFWSLMSQGLNRQSSSPLITATPLNRNSYVASVLPLQLFDLIATGLQALFSEVLRSRDLQSPIFLSGMKALLSQYELLVMKDNNLYMPATLPNVNYGEEMVSLFGRPPRNELSCTTDVRLNPTVAPTASAPDTLQVNCAKAESEVSKAEFIKATGSNDVVDDTFLESEGPLLAQLTRIIESSGVCNSELLTATGNYQRIDGIFLNSEGRPLVQKAGLAESSYSESGVTSGSSLPITEYPEVIHGLTATKDEKGEMIGSPEETEVVFVDLAQSQEPGNTDKDHQVGYFLEGSEDSEVLGFGKTDVPSRKQENERGWVNTTLEDLDSTLIPEKAAILPLVIATQSRNLNSRLQSILLQGIK